MIWDDPTASLRDRATALLEAANGRAECKRLGAWLDAEGGPDLWQAVVALVAERGVIIPDLVTGKRLLRLGRAREEVSRQRRNPIARDEGFSCAHCGADVPPHGRTARDHCPFCLRSLHVDVVPGDRAAGCGGLMDPVELQGTSAWPVLLLRCRVCGHSQRVSVVEDGSVPDDPGALRAVAAHAG